MRIAITANGPGEFAGWVRPLVAALRARDPAIEVHVIGVPDDFATGREAAYLETLFPGVRAHPPAAYVRLAHAGKQGFEVRGLDRKSTRLNSSHANISYAVLSL